MAARYNLISVPLAAGVLAPIGLVLPAAADAIHGQAGAGMCVICQTAWRSLGNSASPAAVSTANTKSARNRRR